MVNKERIRRCLWVYQSPGYTRAYSEERVVRLRARKGALLFVGYRRLQRKWLKRVRRGEFGFRRKPTGLSIPSWPSAELEEWAPLTTTSSTFASPHAAFLTESHDRRSPPRALLVSSNNNWLYRLFHGLHLFLLSLQKPTKLGVLFQKCIWKSSTSTIITDKTVDPASR